MDLTEYEQGLKEKYGRIGAIPLLDGGTAYFMRPTQDQWDMMQALTDGDDDGGKQRTAYKRLVFQCFVGAKDADGNDLTFAEVLALEGPAFHTGAAGNLVNRLAGTGNRPARFL
jgi:hypothetical protein